MVDGTGFIGKNGQGQIRFNGNKGTISSGVWETSSKKIGMEIDLDGDTGSNKTSTGSTLKMRGLAGTISFDTSAKTNSTNLFIVQGRVADGVDKDGNPTYEAVTVVTDDTTKKTTLSKALNYKDMIKISVGTLEPDGTSTNKDGSESIDSIEQKSSFYMQSLNFDAGAKTGTRIDLQNGKYTSYGNYGRIEIASNSTTFFRLADRTNKVLFIIKGNGDTDGETTSQYYLQSSNFNGSSLTGTRLDLQNGKFTTYGSSGYVIVDSGNDAIFRVYAKSGDNYHGLMYVGNKSTYYIQNLDWATSGGIKGSKWNLKDGSFNAYGDGGKISIQPNSKEHLFEVQDSAGTTLINIGNGTYGSSNSYYYLQSSGYQLSTKDTKGQGFRIDIGNGTIFASDFNLFAKGTNGYIQIGTNGAYAIDVNNKFQVAWDGDTHLRGDAALYVETGNIYSGKKDGSGDDAPGNYYHFTSTGGTIAGWTIDKKKIFTTGEYNSEIGAEGTILLDGITWTLDFSGSDFSIFKHGSNSWDVSSTHLAFNNTGMHMQVLEHSKFDFTSLGCYIDADSPGGHIIMRLGSAAAPEFGESVYYASEVNFACNGAKNIFRLSDSYFYVSGADNDLWLDGAGLEINLVQKSGFAAPALTITAPELIINGSTGKTESVEFDPGPGLNTLYLNFVNGIFISATSKPAPPSESK
jgi:hypothetical protein